MRNFPIFIKFLMILSLFGGLAIGSSVFSTVQMNAIDGAYSNLIVHQETIALYLARANRAFAVMRASIGELVLSTTAEGNKSAADNLKEARNSFLDSIRRAKSAAVTSGPAIEELQQRVLQVVDQACAESIRLGNSAAVDDVTAAKKAFLQDCGPRFAPVSALFVDRVDKAVDSATQISEELNQTTKLDVVITHGVILGGLALVTLLAFFTVRAWIAKPIELLTGSMERLANGDLTTELPDTTRRDEIGTMARTVLVFKESGLVKTRLEQEAKAAAAAAETQRAAAEQERAAVARAQAKVVEDLANALSRPRRRRSGAKARAAVRAGVMRRCVTTSTVQLPGSRKRCRRCRLTRAAYGPARARSPKRRTIFPAGRSIKPPALNKQRPHLIKSQQPSSVQPKTPPRPRLW